MSKVTVSFSGPFHSKKGSYRLKWFFLVLGCGGMIYFHAMHQKGMMYREMKAELHQLEKDKALALAHQEQLLLQIQSQSDPAWVEMVLKRNLGMVCEGQVKVYFHDHP